MITLRNKEIRVLFFVYLLSYFFLLINYGIYWDDYVIYNQSPKTIFSMFDMSGNVLKGYFHVLLLSFKSGIVLYRFITFTLFFFTGVIVYKISENIVCLKDYKFLIAFFYLIAPLNSAKIALINTPAIILLFMFFLGFYLFSVYLNNNNLTFKKNIAFRLIILMLFFISFMQNSLLVFYIIILMYLIYFFYSQDMGFYKIIKTIFLKYFDFMILPIVFWGFKKIYLVPYGLYAHYNIIHLDLTTLKLMKESFFTSFLYPIYNSIFTLLHYWYIFLPLFIIYIFLFRNFKLNHDKWYIFLLLGIVLFFLAVFPYVAVNKLPRLENMWSRHQLLIPLGFAFLIIAFILLLSNLKIKVNIIVSFFAAVFTLQTFMNYLNFEKDWFYQLSIMENMKKNIYIHHNNTFVYKLKNQKYLANGRGLNFYQLNGMSKQVFGKDNKFFVQSFRELKSYLKYRKYSQYNFYRWKFKNKIIVFTINLKSMEMCEFINLMYSYLFNRENFQEKVLKYSSIKIRKVANVK